jgi:hypothetical protein
MGRNVFLKEVAVYSDDIPDWFKYGPQNKDALAHEKRLILSNPGPYNKERYLRGGARRGGKLMKAVRLGGKAFKVLLLISAVVDGPEAAARDLVCADELSALGQAIDDEIEKASHDRERSLLDRTGFSREEQREWLW